MSEIICVYIILMYLKFSYLCVIYLEVYFGKIKVHFLNECKDFLNTCVGIYSLIQEDNEINVSF